MATSVTTPSTTREKPVFVPGYGWVRWSKALLDAQARYLLLLHQPDQRWTRLRFVGGRRASDKTRCLYCGQEWTCPEAAWAAAWVSPLARVRGRPARRRGGRHRAPGSPRVVWTGRRGATRRVAAAAAKVG
ncbi:hypothetical protein [Thermasporomyces composti]|jgi:hypothetical protein|uniref:Uncharacterized protein n=1 Tax=Thermasporomyces composti TaxID=696763 RepID=A0A3D9V6V0_THECX|nr:hypothetical protein [Thermasporomyces composti]REF37508.1 hypothetical protein DFJ64_2952 [Thermasporomyces composti]